MCPEIVRSCRARTSDETRFAVAGLAIPRIYACRELAVLAPVLLRPATGVAIFHVGLGAWRPRAQSRIIGLSL